MLFSNVNLKNIKKTEHSLSEGTRRIPYIYCHWEFNMYNPYSGAYRTEMCTQITRESCENADSGSMHWR